MKTRFYFRIRRIWYWIGKRPKKITIPVAVLLIAIISIATSMSIDFYGYMQHDPNFCNSCHVMEESWDKWALSEHKEVDCHQCHQQSVFASANQLFSFIFGDFERVEEHSKVADHVCEECHASGESPEWIQVAATAGHRQHAEEENIACTKCHSVTVHRFEAPGPICSVCHDDKHVETEGMADMHCVACHEYLVDKDELLPQRSGCLNCHESLIENGITFPDEAPMHYDCGECHKPHEKEQPMVDCSDCHVVSGLHLSIPHSAGPCQNCHQPHKWSITKVNTCLTCHPGRVDHNPGILCARCHSFQ